MSGTLAAPTPEVVVDQLKRQGYLVTQTREVASGQPSGDLVGRWLRRIGYDDLMLFNVQLSKMVKVGIPLVTALETLSRQAEHPRLRVVVGEVARAVESGESFSEALSRHPRVFSPLFISMVRAAEVSGKLDEILRRLAEFTKHQAQLRQQVQTAMTYPVLLFLVGVAVTTFLLMGIIPKFMQIFQEAGVPLPLPTLVLYRLSQLLRSLWPALLALVVMGGVGFGRLARTASGRRWLDRALLRVPVIGDLVRKAAVSRLTRTLATLLSSGVPVLESLAIAEQTCGNAVIGDVMREAQANVRQGRAISEPLKASPQFPPLVVQMVVVGESSGTLDHMLGEVADHYDELIQHGIKRLMALVEPFFLMTMGAMVALIMASVLLPLFRMVNVIRS